MEVPFVSEDFQRAFRNQFPAQVSTGRDLHVSDVVLPIVDFTPTASGASLPINLRQARNLNTTYASVNASQASSVQFTPSTGFYYVCHQVTADDNQVSSSIMLRNNITTTETVIAEMTSKFPNGGHSIEEFYAFVPTGYKMYRVCSSNATNLIATYIATQLTNVNGDQINPNGYNPQ